MPAKRKGKSTDDLTTIIDTAIKDLFNQEAAIDSKKLQAIKLAIEWVRTQRAMKEGEDGNFFRDGGGNGDDPQPAANGHAAGAGLDEEDPAE